MIRIHPKDTLWDSRSYGNSWYKLTVEAYASDKRLETMWHTRPAKS